MSRLRRLTAVLLLFLLSLTACAQKEVDGEVTKLIFDRGHGSAWGNQLYMEICPQEITLLRKVGADGALHTWENLPVSAENWEQLEAILKNISLEKESVSLWQSLFASQKRDGGLYRNLTLVYGEKQLRCQWPADDGGLEAFLELLAQEVTA